MINFGINGFGRIGRNVFRASYQDPDVEITAVNDITEGKNDAAFEAKKFVQEVYDELLKFDFRSSSLRKSFDRLRYNLTKIEEISLKVVIKSVD